MRGVCVCVCVCFFFFLRKVAVRNTRAHSANRLLWKLSVVFRVCVCVEDDTALWAPSSIAGPCRVRGHTVRPELHASCVFVAIILVHTPAILPPPMFLPLCA